MNGGWLKIYYQFREWEWYGDTNMVRLFIHLLLSANYKPIKWHGIEIPRGSLVTSRSQLSAETGLTEREIRTCLKRLISTSEISSKTTNRFTIITVNQYESYQGCEEASDQANDQQNDQRATSKRPANDQQTTNGTYNSTIYSEERKNIRNKEIYNNFSSTEEKSDFFSADAVAPTAVKSEVGEKKESLPFKKIKDEWNAICTAYPKLHVLSESRKNKIRNRIGEMGGIEKALPLIKLIFEKMMASPFLKGDNPRGWKASFDWVFTNDKNWVKIYEGIYDPRPAANQTITTPKTRNNGTTDIYSNGNAGYEARQREFQRHVREKLNSPDPVEPDITGYY